MTTATPPTPSGRGTATLSPRLQSLQKLMPYRVREVLLVASRYDSFILEEEGKVTDLILKEYDRLNLRYAPRLNAAPSAREALRLLASDRRFDMVIVTMHPQEMDPADFAREVRRRFPRIPVILLGYDNRELQELRDSEDALAFDRIFIWTGDARILLAMVNLIEDERNVEHDTSEVGLEVIIFVEDSIHFISSELPILYDILMKQSQRLIAEGITLSDKVLRMRARPKILLATSFEEAWALYDRFRRFVLGIVSDVRYRREGSSDTASGVAFAQRVRAIDPDVPILLQSSEARNAMLAASVNASFLPKQSPRHVQELEQFMLDSFGFGPFIFRMPDGSEAGVAHDLRELREHLEIVPAESFRYHAARNHFSAWLKARAEFGLAAELRPRKESDYESLESMRESVIALLDRFRREAYRAAITQFSPRTFPRLSRFAKIGGGSIGGKARGLAFLNTLIREHHVGAAFDDVEVMVPPTVVIGTEVFDRFIDANGLATVSRSAAPDEEIRRAFLDARLPDDVIDALRALVDVMRCPFAVRSSSLLEDSQHQPFAGVYETYMLPNSSDELEVRLRELCSAVKLVYASTFSRAARTYLEATPHRPEKEKMAVMIQELIGRRHGAYFFPTMAGVALSYNYYPFGRVKPEDGAVRVAVGLGKMVVEDGKGLRFCPRYPRHIPQFSSVDDILEHAQKEFDALALDGCDEDPHRRFQPTRLPIEIALGDRSFGSIASTYSHENHAVHDGLAREGLPLVTFAGVLKHRSFPLPELLCRLLEIGTGAMSTPVEIEFAVDLEAPEGGPRTFAPLQMRPLSVLRDLRRIDLTGIDNRHLLCRSHRALGNGRIRGIQDVVCIVPGEFDRSLSRATAAAVAEMNARLRKEGRPYLLIGPGRWGSADPWLGIPVNWGQIAGARIIVETAFKGISVAPSEGSHFFQNMIAFHVGYMTTDPDRGDETIDWEWLLAQETIIESANGIRWIRLSEPALGLIDGRSGLGVVAKAADLVSEGG